MPEGQGHWTSFLARLRHVSLSDHCSCGDKELTIFSSWLRTQPIVTFDLGLLGECLKRKEEERKKVQKADVKEHQWELVREIADSLKGKRIVDDGDKEILGL